MSNSESLTDPVKLRFLISTGCPPVEHRQGSPVFILVWLPLRVTPITPGVHPSVVAVFVRIDASVFPLVGQGRQLQLRFVEATSGFARATTRRIAQFPIGTFVKKLSVSGYPSHLLQATWVNYQIPMAGL